MSAPKLTLIDMDIDPQNSAQSQLQFQEFSSSDVGSAAQLDVNESQTLTFNHSPDTPGSDSDGTESDLLKNERSKQAPSFWSFEYYQQFFDVDTNKVVERIVWSMIPKPGVSYLQHHIKPKPDLYGPFWICVTLVFTIAISGNLANYLQVAASKDYHWKYDFHAVTFAATAIFSYAWVVPMILWGVLKWRGGQDVRLSFLEILCVYGYSLSIYVPISILWVIQIEWLRWLLVVVGATLSGSVLLMTTWPAAQGEQRLVVLAGVLGLHLLLAVGFMLYFFHVTPLEVSTQSVVIPAGPKNVTSKT
ncbi:protein YIPF1 [Bacillus rossius redtenbacheri]|uniref:protein YIPF1 n=1 Tax=Bacillus rossius redtenbacheri TaxID=93214 RepID=UPI002FDCB471